MAGIYIHIPFCKQACHYCDFHFSTNLKHKDEMVTAISQEIVLRNAYLNQEEIQSVYFGGGTPSILPSADIRAIFTSIEQNFSLASFTEITLEANPDDIRNASLKEWRSIGIA
jgi:oxygen-independent coproporphyrinogen III oxidase